VECISRWEPPHSCGGGALQRSAKRSALITRFTAGDRKTPGAKAHFKIALFTAGLKSSSPLLKQGAPTKSLRSEYFRNLCWINI
jgi:hypothetical protein